MNFIAPAIETRPMPPSAPHFYPHDRRRFNAQKHGLTSGYTVLPGEDAALFDTLVRGLAEEYAPATLGEWIVTEEMAAALWRTRRCRRSEHELYGRVDETVAPAGVAAAAASLEMSRLAIYEGRLDRKFLRAFDALLKMRKARAAKLLPEPPPSAGNPNPDERADAAAASGEWRDVDRAAEEASGTVSSQTVAPTVEPPSETVPDTPSAAPPPDAGALPAPAASSLAPAVAPSPPPAASPLSPSAVALPPAAVSPGEPTEAQLLALADARAGQIEAALAAIAGKGAERYDTALGLLDERMRRWWVERVAGKQRIGDTCFDIELWERSWCGRPNAAGLREWLNAVRWNDRELRLRLRRRI